MPEINLRTLSEADQMRYGSRIPNFSHLRRSDSPIYIEVDADGIPIENELGELIWRVPTVPMPDYTAPERVPEKHEPEPKIKVGKVKKIGELIVVMPLVEKISIAEMDKPKPKRYKSSLPQSVAKEIKELYAGGYSYAEICKLLNLKLFQTNNYISKYLYGTVTPTLSAQMIEKIRYMWLMGSKAKGIAISLGYNYWCVHELIAGWTVEADGAGLKSSEKMRIRFMSNAGLKDSEIAAKLGVWVGFIHEFLSKEV